MSSPEKLQIGTVVSTKMDKTVIVRIDRSKRHRLYGKTLRVTQRYKAHDETNECNLGDVVKIAETRPLSREKRWRVVEVVTKGDVAEVAPREIAANILQETRDAADAEAAAARAAAAPPDDASDDADDDEAVPDEAVLQAEAEVAAEESES